MLLTRRMKHVLILLFSIVVGEFSRFSFKSQFLLLSENSLSVFSVYKSFGSADETRGLDNEIDYAYNSQPDFERRQPLLSSAKKEQLVELRKDKRDELEAADRRIRELEKRIAELEDRLPKKYDRVKFLNYQNRKRILVRHGKVWRLCKVITFAFR